MKNKILFGAILTLVLGIAIGAILAETTTAQADTTRYVKAGGTGDGTSWATASGTMQAMIDAIAGAGGGTVWVAAGTYTPTATHGGTTSRHQSFQMKNGVGIYGGFPYTGSPVWADRDWETYETILSGEIGNPGTKADNCYHVFYHPHDTDLDNSAVLDGFYITGGNANGEDESGKGGGMHNRQSYPKVTNCVFQGNHAVWGGAMYNRFYSSPDLTNCTFIDNHADISGGGMLSYEHSSPDVTNCVFVGNTAEQNGGGMYNSHESSPSLTNCTFAGNSASANGGGIANYSSSPKITNCILTGNSADNGGGTYNERSSTVVINCIFWNNLAYNHGSSIYNIDCTCPRVTNSILYGNISSPGKVIYNDFSWPTVTYCDVQVNPGSPVYPGSGNISSTPLFVNPGSEDFHLLPTSPCINMGTNSVPGLPQTDFEGGPRIVNGRVDIGADEERELETIMIVDPPECTVCSKVTIRGYNFWLTPGTEAIITSDITIGGELWISSGSVVAAQTDADNDGLADDFSVSACIPRMHDSGVWQVACQDLLNPENPWAMATIEIARRTVSVLPLAGPPGTNVTIEGTGWCSGDTNGYAIMMYGNTTAGAEVTSVPISVDDQGSFTVVGKIPWEASSGIHGIMVAFDNDGVFNQSDNEISAQGTFTVTDRLLTLVPGNCPFGTPVTLSGARFGPPAAGGTPALYVNGQYQPMEGIDDQPLSSSGYIVPVTFRISRDIGFHYGENIVEIRAMVNDVEASAVADLNVVRPTLQLDRSEAVRGTQIGISGSGWVPGESNFVTFEVDLGNDHGWQVIRPIIPDEYGKISSTYTIPPLDFYDGIIVRFRAYDTNGNQSLVLPVTIIGPQIVVEPTEGAAGDSITVIGIGFQPKAQIQEVSVDHTPIVPVYALWLTSGTGSFKVTGTVPQLPPGGHVVMVRVTQAYNEPITTPFTARAKRIYVNNRATGANDGTSWANAYTNFQDALSNADSPCEIWVAAGTYTPAPPGRSGTRSDSFQLQNGVGIYGGFPAIGSPVWADRDWETYQTILSGEIGNPGTKADNCYHVFYHDSFPSLDGSAIIDGFIITEGKADGGSYPNAFGGGMLNDNASPTIISCTFKDNSATIDGGGIMNGWDSSPNIVDSTFLDNHAGNYGGGIYSWESSPNITNCTFINNTSRYGSGMFNNNSAPLVTDSAFSNNTATRAGGGMYNEASSSPTLTNCYFINNSAENGGGMYNLVSCSPTIIDSSFCENKALYHGGGIFNQDSSSPTLTNCKFVSNVAQRGGGIYNRASSSPRILNCTFSLNSGYDNGGGIYNRDSSLPELANCILWGDASGTPTKSIAEVFSLDGTPTFTFSNIQVNPGSPVYPGIGNISANPLWVNPGSGDFHLLPTSPCINAGSNSAIQATGVTEDFEGDDRIIDGTVDMGVDEVASSAWSCLAYDDNSNGKIEYAEMVTALMDYLTSGISYSQMIDVLMCYLTS